MFSREILWEGCQTCHIETNFKVKISVSESDQLVFIDNQNQCQSLSSQHSKNKRFSNLTRCRTEYRFNNKSTHSKLSSRHIIEWTPSQYFRLEAHHHTEGKWIPQCHFCPHLFPEKQGNLTRCRMPCRFWWGAQSSKTPHVTRDNKCIHPGTTYPVWMELPKSKRQF